MIREAKEVLEAARSGNDDSITVTQLQGGIQIYAGSKHFVGAPGREVATLRAALEELETSGYIERESDSSYRLTLAGLNYKV